MDPEVANDSNSKRLKTLDGWRAIAIFFVLISHLPFSDTFPRRWHWIADVFQGDLGVRCFFVLSGFLITYLMLVEAEENGAVSFSLFYMRRVLRIFPLYIAYLVVLFIATAAGVYEDSLTSWLGCLTFTRNYIGDGGSATVHFWSLAVEEQFYLVWPLLFAGFNLAKRRKLAIFLLFLTIPICSVVRAAFVDNIDYQSFVDRLFGIRSFFRYFDSLAIGCMTAYLWRPETIRPMAAGIFPIPIMIGCIVATRTFMKGFWSAITPHGFGPVLAAVVPSLEAICMAGMMICTASNSKSTLGRILELGFLRTIGVLSYSLYVWHVLFLTEFFPGVFPKICYHFLVWPVLAFIAAGASYRFLEAPFFELRRKFRN